MNASSRARTILVVLVLFLAIPGPVTPFAQETPPPKTVLVLLGEWFGDSYFPLKDEIESRGWTLQRVGVEAEYRGCYNKKRDVVLSSDILIPDLKDFAACDGLIIPSGPQFRKFQEDPAVLQFIRDAHAAGVPIASFCVGNFLVQAAGLVDLPPGQTLFPESVTRVAEGIILGPRGGGPPPGDGFESAPIAEICDALDAEMDAASPGPGPRPDSTAEIRIRWFGQASFQITTSSGTSIVIDPVDFKGYHMPPGTTADIVAVSHEHVDHNRVAGVSGSPAAFRGTDGNCSTVNPIDTTVRDVRLYTVPSFHDPGHRRANAIFVFEFDGIRLAHLGDIGTVLTAEQIAAVGPIDILMLPVGGQYTVAGAEADSLVAQLGPRRLVFPMHYKTPAFDDLPSGVDAFLQNKSAIRRLDTNELVIPLSAAATTREYVVLQY